MERRGHAGLGQQLLGLLGGAALLDGQGVGPLLVEADRVDAVDEDLALEGLGEALERLGVRLPRDRGEHDVGLGGAGGVVGAADVVDAGGLAVLARRVLGALGGPGADDHADPGGRPAQGQALALVAGAAEHSDGQGRRVDGLTG